MKKIITLFSLICAFVCAISCSSSSSPSSVVKAQMEALDKGDAEKIADLFYFDEDKAEEGRQMIVSLMAKVGEKIKQQGGIKSYEIVSEEISESGETAVVVTNIVYGNGETDTQDTKTILHEGKWYLHFDK